MWTLTVLATLAFLALLLHVGFGSSDPQRPFQLRMTPLEVWRELVRGDLGSGNISNTIVWRIRLPRALACVLVGAILGMVGSAFQALFRNPLADPYIVGVSSGAAVGGVVALSLGLATALGGLGMMVLSTVAGLCSLALVYGLARRRGRVDVQTLLLAGVVTGAMLTAVLTLILIGSGQDANQVMRWLLGSTSPMYWNRITIMTAMLLVGAVILLAQAKRLNAFAVGEETAQRLGVDTRRLKPIVLVTGTAMTAAAVGSVGVVGFLGLVAPHLSRRIVGVDWRWSLVGAGLFGATLLLAADVLAQWGLPGGELPVGVITALIGAPFLLALMRRSDG